MPRLPIAPHPPVSVDTTPSETRAHRSLENPIAAGGCGGDPAAGGRVRHLLSALFESQRAQNEASSLGVARALATAVEGELRLTMSALQTLALADPLGTADGEGKAQALALSRAVRASHPEWRGLLLADPSGRVVFSTETDRPTSANVVKRSSFDATVLTRRPVAGSMARGAGGNLAFPVRVPVVRDGVVKYVLTAIIRPEAIAAMLRAQRVPEGWYVSVFDANLARIARTVDDEKWRGSGPIESLKPFFQALGHDKQELLGTSTNVDGVLAKTVLARLDEGAGRSSWAHRCRRQKAPGGAPPGPMYWVFWHR